jgi:hypothetical protein
MKKGYVFVRYPVPSEYPTGWATWGSNPDIGKRFSLLQSVQTGSDAIPSILLSEYRGYSGLGVKLTTHRHLPPPTAEIKNQWS